MPSHKTTSTAWVASWGTGVIVPPQYISSPLMVAGILHQRVLGSSMTSHHEWGLKFVAVSEREVLFDLDSQPLRLGRRWPGYLHFQHAILIGGFNGVGIGSFRQAYGPAKATI
jgi:hypothetical protein